MDEVITKTKKSKEVEINAKELFTESQHNSEEINVSIFDKTLKEIDQILNRLEQKSEINQKQLDEKLEIYIPNGPRLGTNVINSIKVSKALTEP